MNEELNVDLGKTSADMNHSDVKSYEHRAAEVIRINRILHLRRILLVHSYLYYVLDDPVVPDDVWQSWANELAEINTDIGFYDEAFKDWDGTTGYYLPFEDKWIVSKALQIRRLTQNKELK